MKDSLNTIAIVGLGRMGIELSRDFAEQGIKVYGIDIDPKARAAAADYAEVGESVAIIPRSVDAVLELVPEDRALKAEVLGAISRQISRDTAVWMGSSMIPSSSFAHLFSNPHRLMNTHFLPDLEVRRFVELQGSAVNERVLEEMQCVKTILEGLAFNVATINGESQGFLFNNVWHAVMYTAIRLLDEGVPPETIDKSMCAVFPARYGPCACMDLIGYRTLRNVFGIAAELDPNRPVPGLVTRMLGEGRYGLESGRGIYDYDSNELGALHAKAKVLADDPRFQPDERVTSALMSTVVERLSALREAGQDPGQLSLAVQKPKTRE